MKDQTFITHEAATLESLRRDPAFAAVYLEDVFEAGDAKEILQALKRVAKAFGVSQVAGGADLHAKTLYRSLSDTGNPELKTLIPVLKVMGLRLSVAPLQGRSVSQAHVVSAPVALTHARMRGAVAHAPAATFASTIVRPRASEVLKASRFSNVGSGSVAFQLVAVA